MNRQGIDSFNELKDFITLCLAQKHIKIGGFYSHFAKPENKSALKRQLDKFLLANKLIKGYNNNVTCHISASGGFLAGVQLDMVRIGILLYGYKPFESSFIQVEPAMQIFAPIVEQRRLKVGEHALYGNKKAERETQFNLVRYGYADGLFRKEIDGQFNNRCMDLSAMCGERVTELGYPVMTNADILAKRYDTISYEILTKASLRAEKIYLN
jgi:alanine racemase